MCRVKFASTLDNGTSQKAERSVHGKFWFRNMVLPACTDLCSWKKSRPCRFQYWVVVLRLIVVVLVLTLAFSRVPPASTP